ncbi:MAG: hypothetical protein A2Y73_04440 [Chloroflexi bacterium RBG_13_56_8]|nr:MAG: hypothetical protein A2Y73_04440 [Chloroflexi bacterium RBG_13_56_8]
MTVGQKKPYSLGFIREKQIRLVRPLTDYEHREIVEAVQQLMRFQSRELPFGIVRWNYEEWSQLLDGYMVGFRLHPRAFFLLDPARTTQMLVDVNRVILNFLSSVRTFLDHSEAGLKRRYGAASKEINQFKNAASWFYDNVFSYRFLYQVRNYAQHYALPLGRIEERQRGDLATGKVISEVALYFSRDDLFENNFAWKKPLAEELPTLPSLIEIGPNMEEMMKCLDQLDVLLIEFELPALNEAVDILETYLADLEGVREHVYVFKRQDVESPKTDSQLIQLSQLPIPVWLIDRIESTRMDTKCKNNSQETTHE